MNEGVKNHESEGPENDSLVEEIQEEYDRYVQQAYESGFNIELSKEELMSQAEVFIREDFMKYDPEQSLSDISFYGLCYKLDRLFYPNSPPENTGSLEPDVAEFVLPLLEKLKSTYPGAVKRFYGLFYQGRREWREDHGHRYNPYRPWVASNEKVVIEYYRDLLESDSGVVVSFALQAMDSGVNAGIGVLLISDFIEKAGWQEYLDTATQNLYNKEGHSCFNSLVESVYKLSTPKDLSTEQIEALHNFAQNDLEWISLDSYLSIRKKSETLELISDVHCRDILRDKNVPFYDVDRTREKAAELMNNSFEVRYGLLQELYWGLREMWTNYPNEEDSPFILEQMDKWEQMDASDLLESIDPVYAFNVISTYSVSEDGQYNEDMVNFDRNQVLAELMLDPEEIRLKTKALVGVDPDAYQRVMFETEFQSKSSKSAMMQCSQYDLLRQLKLHAYEERRTGPDVWGYALNSSAVFVARNTLATYSPTGRLLELNKVDQNTEEKVNRMEFADFVSMKNDMSGSGNFSQVENATATTLLFWNRLPADWQERIRDIFAFDGIDIDYWVQHTPDSFELAANFGQEIVPVVASMGDYPVALVQYIDEMLEKMQNELIPLEEIDDNELLVLMDSEYGESDIDESVVRETIRSLNFDTTMLLRESFGIDFSQLKRREFFGLLNYLKQSKEGKGLENLKKIASTSHNEDEALHRIRVFMSLEHGDVSLGDDIVRFSDLQEEAADIFASYSELLDEVDNLEEFIESELDCEALDCAKVAAQARERLLNDAQKYLIKAVTNHSSGAVQGLSERTIEAKALSAAFTTYLATGHSSIEGLRSLEKKEYEQSTVDPELLETLIDIYQKNYENLDYDQSAIEELVSSLKERISRPETKVRTWEFGEQNVLAFAATTEDTTNESVYISGLNVNPELKTAQAARSLLEEIVAEYSSRGWTILAEASPHNFQGYAEMGWVATARKNDDLGAEAYLFDIAIIPDHHFASKDLSRKELRERVVETNESYDDDGILVWKSTDPTATPPELSKEYVLTRSFTVKGKNGAPNEYIFALEPMTPPIATQMQNAA